MKNHESDQTNGEYRRKDQRQREEHVAASLQCEAAESKTKILMPVLTGIILDLLVPYYARQMVGSTSQANFDERLMPLTPSSCHGKPSLAQIPLRPNAYGILGNK